MGNYRFDKPQEQEKDAAGRRGLGCIMMIILPAIAYPAAFFILGSVPQVRTAFASVMANLFVPIPLPSALYQITPMTDIWIWIETQNTLIISFIFGSLILMALYGFVSMLFAMMFRAVNPKRYGPTDAPPRKRKTKRFNR